MPSTIVIAPRGGLRYDIPADLIDTTDMSDCRNVYFEDGLVKQRYGYSTLGNNLPLDGAIVGITQFQDYSGGSWTLVVTPTQIYKLSSSRWDTFSDAGGYFGYGTFGSGAFGANSSDTFSADDNDFISFATVRKTTETDPWLVFTNSVEPIKKWTGIGAISNLFSSLPSGVTAFLCKYLLAFKDYLICAYTTENGDAYPHRIRWTDTGTPDDLLNGNASYQDLSPKPVFADPDEIKGMFQISGDLFGVWKGASVWVGYATGDPYIFQMSRRVNEGTPSGRTVATIDNYAIYMGHEDVLAFNGNEVESVAGSVRREIFDNVNPDQLARCYCKVFRELRQYWLILPLVSNTYPSTAWCLHYDTGKWTRHSFADFLTAQGEYAAAAGGITIGELTMTVGQMNWRIGERASASSAPTTLFGDSDGNVYEYKRVNVNDNDTAVDAWFSTKDFNPTRFNTRFRVNRIDTYYQGSGLDVHYSTNKGASWTSIGSIAASNNLETPQQLFLKLDAPLCRLRWRNSDSNENFSFSRATIYWEPSGGRL